MTPEQQATPPKSSPISEPLTARGYHPGRRSIPSIQEMVGARQAVSLEAILGRSRVQRIVTARHIAMWLARREGYSTTRIALEFGIHNHTSVMKATRKIDRRIADDVEFAARLMKHRAILGDVLP